MACEQWDKLGLLFMSGELPPTEREEFCRHVRECPSCRSEIDVYEKERACLFCPDFFIEEPSAKVDDRIRRHCFMGMCMPVGVRLFPMLVRRSIVSIGVLALGVMVGVVAVTRVEPDRALSANYVSSDTSDVSVPQLFDNKRSEDETAVVVTDTVDSIREPARRISPVIPVDLRRE